MDVLKIKITPPTENDTKTLFNVPDDEWERADRIFVVEFLSGALDGKKWTVSGNLPIKRIVREAERDIKGDKGFNYQI